MNTTLPTLQRFDASTLTPAVLAKRRKKAHQVKAGDVSLPLYTTRWYDKKRRRTYTSHVVVYHDAQGEHRIKRASRKAAEARGLEIANSIANGEISMAELTQKDRGCLLLIYDTYRPVGIAPELGSAHYVRQIQTLRTAGLPDSALDQAVDSYISQHPATAVPKTCPDILQEMLAARKADGAAQNTLDDIESRIGRFAQAFTGPVMSITGKDINDWLRKLTVSRRTRNNYRGALVAFYRFAKQAQYVPKTWTVMDDVPRAKDETVQIVVFPPDEFIKIIRARETTEAGLAARRRPYKTLIPYLAIGAWAGCRHEEMCAGRDPRGRPLPVLDWRDVDFKRKRIHVREEVARKIGRDRFVPMSDNLVAWLSPYARPSGPICELANANNAFQRAAAAAGVKWRDNGLRRTFISSRLALVKDIGQVALEAGTSPERINKNYKKTMDEEDAARWFALVPFRADVLPLFAWGKRAAN